MNRPVPTPPLVQDDRVAEDEASTEDDEDLDAPSGSQNQSQTLSRVVRQSQQHTESPAQKPPSEPATSPPSVSRSKAKGFRIGGKAKRASSETSPENETTPVEPARATMSPPLQTDSVDASPKKPRRAFKIGGKRTMSQELGPSQQQVTISSSPHHGRNAQSPTPQSSPPPMPQEIQKEETPVEEVHEETPEEKAERKRAELKRKNEELAKKQAQHKRKKRF